MRGLLRLRRLHGGAGRLARGRRGTGPPDTAAASVVNDPRVREAFAAARLQLPSVEPDLDLEGDGEEGTDLMPGYYRAGKGGDPAAPRRERADRLSLPVQKAFRLGSAGVDLGAGAAEGDASMAGRGVRYRRVAGAIERTLLECIQRGDFGCGARRRVAAAPAHAAAAQRWRRWSSRLPRSPSPRASASCGCCGIRRGPRRMRRSRSSPCHPPRRRPVLRRRPAQAELDGVISTARRLVTARLNMRYSPELRFQATDARVRERELDALFEATAAEIAAVEERQRLAEGVAGGQPGSSA